MLTVPSTNRAMDRHTRLKGRIIIHASVPAMLIAMSLFATLGGCQAPISASPYAEGTNITRNSLRSQELATAALQHMESDPTKAESLLKQALEEDLFNGPAHNNLGVLYLRAEPPKLYEAASEFEWASKLLPGQPDPRHNRAMVLERAGRMNDALEGYAAALDIAPGYMPALQGKASLCIRLNKPDDTLQASLSEIALRGTTEKWRLWAKSRLLRMQ